MSGAKHSVIKGVAWVGVGRVVVALIGLVSTVVLARLLSPEDFGLVAIAAAAAAIIGMLTDLPLSQALIQHDEPGDEHLHTIWTFGLIKGAVLLLLIGGSAPFIAAAYGDARLQNLVLALAFTAALGTLQNPALAVFERGLVFWQAVMLDLADKSAAFIATVAIAYIYQSYWALVVGVLVAQVVRVAMSHLLRPYRPRLSLGKGRELLSFSIWLTLRSWIYALNWRADPLILGQFIRPGPLGLYTMADRLTSMSVGQVVGPVSQVLFPALSRFKKDVARLQSAYLRMQAMSCILAFPIGAGFAILAQPIVLLVLGEKWLPAVPIVQVLALLAASLTIQLIGPLAMALGETKALFRLEIQLGLARLPLLVGGILLGQVSGLGMLMGAVLGRAAAQAVMTIWTMYLVKRLSGLRLRNQFGSIGRPALASLIMVLAVGGALWLTGPLDTSLTGYVSLFTLILWGGVVYAGALFGLWLATGRKSGAEEEMLAMALAGARRIKDRRTVTLE